MTIARPVTMDPTTLNRELFYDHSNAPENASTVQERIERREMLDYLARYIREHREQFY